MMHPKKVAAIIYSIILFIVLIMLGKWFIESLVAFIIMDPSTSFNLLGWQIP